MTLMVNVKNVPSEVNRPYIVVRFCNGELWYYGQYDDVERANDVAEGLGMATVFDNSSYNAIEALEQEPILDKIRTEIRHHSEHFINDDGEDCLALYEDDVIEIVDKYRKEQE